MAWITGSVLTPLLSTFAALIFTWDWQRNVLAHSTDEALAAFQARQFANDWDHTAIFIFEHHPVMTWITLDVFQQSANSILNMKYVIMSTSFISKWSRR